MVCKQASEALGQFQAIGDAASNRAVLFPAGVRQLQSLLQRLLRHHTQRCLMHRSIPYDASQILNRAYVEHAAQNVSTLLLGQILRLQVLVLQLFAASGRRGALYEIMLSPASHVNSQEG